MTNDNYPAGVTDADFEGGHFVNCVICGQENVEFWVEDPDAIAAEFENECSNCGEPICSDCWKKCPEDNAGDKVCEECAR